MYRYDVALSYESASRDLVRKVAGYLKSESWRVFFAEEEQQEMLSEPLREKLYQIYQRDSLVKVLFVTEKYLQSEYTMLEKRCSLRSTKNNARRLIVVNFMGKRLPEDLRDSVYLDGNIFADEIASFIGRRIAECRDQDAADTERPTGQKAEDNDSFRIANVSVNNGIRIGDNANLRNVKFETDSK